MVQKWTYSEFFKLSRGLPDCKITDETNLILCNGETRIKQNRAYIKVIIIQFWVEQGPNAHLWLLASIKLAGNYLQAAYIWDTPVSKDDLQQLYSQPNSTGKSRLLLILIFITSWFLLDWFFPGSSRYDDSNMGMIRVWRKKLQAF